MGSRPGAGDGRNTQLCFVDPDVRDTGTTRWGGGRAPKIRIAGDFRASGISDAMSALDANIPESMGVFLARIAFYRRIAPDVELGSFSLDFSRKYKHVPIRASRREFPPRCLLTLKGALSWLIYGRGRLVLVEFPRTGRASPNF